MLKCCPTFEGQRKSCLWWHVIRQRAPVPLKMYHQWDYSGIFMYVFVWVPWNATVTISHTCGVLLICYPQIRFCLTAQRWLRKSSSNSVILSCALQIWWPRQERQALGMLLWVFPQDHEEVCVKILHYFKLWKWDFILMVAHTHMQCPHSLLWNKSYAFEPEINSPCYFYGIRYYPNPYTDLRQIIEKFEWPVLHPFRRIKSSRAWVFWSLSCSMMSTPIECLFL